MCKTSGSNQTKSQEIMQLNNHENGGNRSTNKGLNLQEILSDEVEYDEDDK